MTIVKTISEATRRRRIYLKKWKNNQMTLLSSIVIEEYTY